MTSRRSVPTQSMMSIVKGKIALSAVGCLIVIIFHLVQAAKAIDVKRNKIPSVHHASEYLVAMISMGYSSISESVLISL